MHPLGGQTSKSQLALLNKVSIELSNTSLG